MDEELDLDRVIHAYQNEERRWQQRRLLRECVLLLGASAFAYPVHAMRADVRRILWISWTIVALASWNWVNAGNSMAI